MSDLSDSMNGLVSDKKGRRFYSANIPVNNSQGDSVNPPNPNYNKEDQEEISLTFEQNLICGTAIPINLTNLGRFNQKAKREKGELRGDSGMHIVDLENETSDLENDYLF